MHGVSGGNSLFRHDTLIGLHPLVSNWAAFYNFSEVVFQFMLSPGPVQSSLEYSQIRGLHIPFSHNSYALL